VPLFIVITVLPAVAFTVPPLQVVLAAAGLEATVNPEPIVVKLSVKDVMVAWVFAVLERVIVRVLCPPCTLVLGEKLLLTETGVAWLTVKVALVAG
jgi:hypothetical protein